MSTEISNQRISVIAATVSGMVMMANLYAGKTARDAFFLSHFDVTDLPLMMIASAVLSGFAVIGFSGVLARLGPALLIPPMFIGSGLFFSLQWFLLPYFPAVSTVVLYLHATVLTSLLISGFWSILNERWDPHTGKRVMARLVGLNTLGGLLGAAAANGINQMLDSRDILALLCVLHIGCGFGLYVVVRGRSEEMGKVEAKTTGGVLDVLKRNVTIRRIALMMLVYAAMVALVDYLFKSILQESIPTDQLVTFFSYFYMIIGLSSALLQSTLGNKALTWLGVGGSMATLPFSVIAGAIVGFVLMSLYTATLLRGAIALLTTSFFRSGSEPLFTPIPKHDKRAAKVLIDLGADRLGDILGSGIILFILLLPGSIDHYLLTVIIVFCVVMLLIIFLLQRDYIAQLARNLLEAADVRDEGMTVATQAHSAQAFERATLLRRVEHYRDTREATGASATAGDGVVYGEPKAAAGTDSELTAISALTSGEDERIRQCLASRTTTAATLPFILPLLKEKSALRETLNAAVSVASTAPGQLVDALLDLRQHPLVRRRIPLLLARSDNRVAALGLTLGLQDPEVDVRFRCAQALAQLCSSHPELKPDENEIEAVIYRELARLKESGYGKLQGVEPLKHLFNLFAIEFGRDVMDMCYDSLDSEDVNIRGTALEYLENQLPTEIRLTLWPLIAPDENPKGSERSIAEIMRDLKNASEKKHRGEGPQ